MKLQHYIIPDWPAPKNVFAYTTTRQGGHSKPPFDSFNFSYSSGDNHDDVAANHLQLKNELKLPSNPCWLKQVHGKEVVCADHAEKYTIADGAFATKANTICVVSTADCLPVFFCHPAGNNVAVAHAGWRGLAAGIIEATWQAMQIPAKETLVWLGPAIGPTTFEVGEEVRQQFLQVDSLAQTAFRPSANPGKWFANLYQLAAQRLNKLGITQIYGGNFCTYTDQTRFFSYRRDQGKTGRMLSLIWHT